MALNNVRGEAIIMAGAGMATGGRVRHHLKHNISREECSVISWALPPRHAGRGRSSHGQKSSAHLRGRYSRLRARVHTING